MFVGHCLGWVNSRVLMTVVFYLVVTPAALVMRVMGRDEMGRRRDPSASTLPRGEGATAAFAPQAPLLTLET